MPMHFYDFNLYHLKWVMDRNWTFFLLIKSGMRMLGLSLLIFLFIHTPVVPALIA